MPIISVRIPQLGEGLQEALLVEFIAKPGDQIKRDAPIYVMETDKATTDVESPYDGTLVEWTVEEGNVLSIGTEVAKMEVAEGVREMSAGHGSPAKDASASSASSSASVTGVPTTDVNSDHFESIEGAKAGDIKGGGVDADNAEPATANVNIPPRTRKYLKDRGLMAVAHEILAEGGKLMPADVDRYLAARKADSPTGSPSGSSGEATPAKASPRKKTPADTQPEMDTDLTYTDIKVSKVQQTLNYRLHRGAQACVQVTMMKEVDWTAIARAREIARKTNGESAFTMLLWCVVKSMQRHDRFRSSLISNNTLRTFDHVQLGIAVGLPSDELVTAVVKQADTLSRPEFNDAVARQVGLARQGTDQADASTTFTVSNIGGQAIRWGIPAIVSPAVATLAVGEVFDKPVAKASDSGQPGFEFRRTVQLVLAFDHRVANGVGAAAFLNDIASGIESFTLDS